MPTLSPELLAQFQNKTLPRGIRNNNPGNIDWSINNDWRGQFKPSDLPAAARDPRFAQFEAPEFGIRAMLLVFRTYQSKYERHTVAELVSRWAPASENDTQAYIKSAAASAGITPNTVVNFLDAKTAIGFAKAIVAHETGKGAYYADEVYARAFALTK